MPDVEVLRGAKVGTLALDDFLEELNRRIAKTEGEKTDRPLVPAGGRRADHRFRRVRAAFQQEILPLLQEYCYDDYTGVGDVQARS